MRTAGIDPSFLNAWRWGGGGGGGYSTGVWVGRIGRLNETLTLFKTQRCRFATLSNRKCRNLTLFKTGQSITVFKTIVTIHKFAFHAILNEGTHEISENFVVDGGRKEYYICEYTEF